MSRHQPSPGVSRTDRISDQGLDRLQKQLASGVNVSEQVLAQWIRRYGVPARELIRQHGRDSAAFDAISNDQD